MRLNRLSAVISLVCLISLAFFHNYLVFHDGIDNAVGQLFLKTGASGTAAPVSSQIQPELLKAATRSQRSCNSQCVESEVRSALGCSNKTALSVCSHRFLYRSAPPGAEPIFSLPKTVQGCFAGAFCAVNSLPLGPAETEIRCGYKSSRPCQPDDNVTVSVISTYYNDNVSSLRSCVVLLPICDADSIYWPCCIQKLFQYHQLPLLEKAAQVCLLFLFPSNFM